MELPLVLAEVVNVSELSLHARRVHFHFRNRGSVAPKAFRIGFVLVEHFEQQLPAFGEHKFGFPRHVELQQILFVYQSLNFLVSW